MAAESPLGMKLQVLIDIRKNEKVHKVKYLVLPEKKRSRKYYNNNNNNR